MLAPSLASLALLSSAVVVSASSHRAGRFPHKRAADDLARRRDGGSNARATYYDTSVGPGACGIVHQNNEWTVALNSDQLREWGGGYPSAACGQTISIQYTSDSGVTSTKQATIQDECPTCPYGGLDLSTGLFESFENLGKGVLSINWWYGSSGGSPAPAPTTSEAPAPTTSEAPAPSTTEEAAWTSTTSEAAWTSVTSSEMIASASSAAADVNIGAAVIPAESSFSSSAQAAPTTTSAVVPAETWVAPTTSSTAEWLAPTMSSAEAWVAPTTTALAWSAAAPSASASPELVLDGQTLCPSTPQFVVLAKETVLYNGTVLSFLNESLAATANATLYNSTSPYDLADYLCYNATLFSVDLYEASTANATLASVVANVTAPTTFGLFKTNATVVNFAKYAATTNNTELPAANVTFLLGTNVTLASFESFVAATANVTTAELLAAASSGADNSTSHALVEIFDMLAASRSPATATCLEQSIVDKIERAEAVYYEDDDSLPWCDDEDEEY